MKEQSLYELIGEIGENSNACRFLNKQKIVDYTVNHFNKLLVYRDVVKVCKILLENFNDSYNLDKNLELAIYDYLDK